MSDNFTATPAPPTRREQWTREVLVAAEALRQTGSHKRLGEMTIVLPIDRAAVAAIELACLALAAGELSEAARELDHFLDRLAADPAAADRFLTSVRTIVERVGPLPDPPT